MPVPAPQHGAVFVQELLRDLAAQGIPPGRVLAGSGLAPAILQADRPSAPFDAIARVFENAAEITGEDCLGFRRGLRRDMRSIGLLCYVGLAAPRLRDVLKNIERYRRVFSDAVEFDTSSLDRDGRLRWYFGVSAQVRRRQ